MRVLNVLDFSPAVFGGIGKQLRALEDMLRSEGHVLHVAFPRRRAWLSGFAASDRVHVLPSIRKPFRMGFPRHLKRLCMEHDIDLIHLHFSFAMPFTMACSCCRIGLPLLYHWHNPPKALVRRASDSALQRTTSVGLRVIARTVAQAGDRIIARHITVSNEIAQLLVEARWTSMEKTMVLPNGLPACVDQARQRRYRRGAVLSVGSVANFRPQKDHGTLLRAIRCCLDRGSNLEVELIGDGETRAAMEDLCTSLRLERTVRFLGSVPHDMIPYGRFDAVVLSTHYEGQGLVLLEAMSRGIPVIATDTPGVREVVGGGVSGILVEPGSPESLAEALVVLAADPNLRRRLGLAGKRIATEKFSIDDWARRQLDAYLAVARANSS